MKVIGVICIEYIKKAANSGVFHRDKARTDYCPCFLARLCYNKTTISSNLAVII